MTHDKTCFYDKSLCSMCKLQAEARLDEREQLLENLANARRNWYDTRTKDWSEDDLWDLIYSTIRK